MTDGIPGDESEIRPDAARPVERLVMRLRDAASNASLEIGDAWNLLDEAAYEIERLQKLRDVVTDYIEKTGYVPGNNDYWNKRFHDAYYA